VRAEDARRARCVLLLADGDTCEPPRDSRRLHNLRGWSHEHIEEVFT
jgi:hypothetical protein